MCLAIPAQVVELRDGDIALVDLAGVKKSRWRWSKASPSVTT